MKRTAIWNTFVLACGLAACGGGGGGGAGGAGGGGGGGETSAEAPRVEASEIDSVLADADVVFLDVREPEELEELGTIDGYINIPVDQLAERLDELPKDKPILTA